MTLCLPGLQPMPHRSPDKGFTPPPGSLSPVTLCLPGLQPMPHRSPDKGFTPLPGNLSPVALCLPGRQPVPHRSRARDLPRRQGISPRWRYAYRGYSRCHTVAGQGIYPAAREPLPGGATLTGATAGAHRSPDKGFTPLPGSLSPVALRLPGLQPVHTVARTRNLPRCPGASPR